MNPNHLAEQNIGGESESREPAQRTAFHLRKAGLDLGAIDDADLKQVPVLPVGTRLQQGATYVDAHPREESPRAGTNEAWPAHAYVPDPTLSRPVKGV